MARKPRVEFEGAFYHVIVRGNQRQKIFRDDQDRLTYLRRIEHYRERHGFVIYAYVLMSNHVHLLVETGRVSLSKIMQGIQFTYTQTYNRRHRTVGHVFQARYKAILCDRDRYLLELVRYIHLNPVRLRTPLDPWRYRWSSYRAYLGEKIPVTIETERLLGQFAKNTAQARRGYMEFMKDGLQGGHEEKYYQTVDQRFLGDETFVEKVAAHAAEKDIQPNGPRVRFERLLEAVAKEHQLPAEALVGSGRQRSWIDARQMLAYLAREWGGLTTQEVGKRLDRDPSMISRLYRGYEEKRNRRKEKTLASALGR